MQYVSILLILCFIKDNGYIFSHFPSLFPDELLWILAEPPRSRETSAFIRDYDRENGTEPHCEKDRTELPCKEPSGKLRKLDVSKQIRKEILECIRDEVNVLRSFAFVPEPATSTSIHDSTEEILKRTGGCASTSASDPAATSETPASHNLVFPQQNLKFKP